MSSSTVPSSRLTFFVTGATGSQGGAVARQLLAGGYKVNALVRNPTGPAAAELSKRGAHLIEGDYENEVALASAATGCDGVFLNTVPTRAFETELTHASNIINAAKTAGVKRIVYSSVVGAEDHESFPDWSVDGLMAGYWKAKSGIQNMTRSSGFESWTIVQPAWIMTNWVAPVSKWYWPELAAEKTLVVAFAEDTQVDLTDPADIGHFTVRALTSGSAELNGQIIRVAGDLLTIGEMAQEMSRVSGVEVKAKFRSDEEIEELKGSSPFVASQLWQRLSGSQVDGAQVRSYGVDVTSFKAFLENNKQALAQAFD